jgi:hypothetical protein
MIKHEHVNEFLSWLSHILVIVVSAFFYIISYSLRRGYSFFFLLAILFIIMFALDRRLERGRIVGVVTAIVLIGLHTFVWFWAKQIQKSNEMLVSMFEISIHPLVFAVITLLCIFIPYYTVLSMHDKIKLHLHNKHH